MSSKPWFDEERVVVKSGEWELIGDLRIPKADDPSPVVLLLNKANGNREVYKEMARQLADRGIASLRLDLRGHGESINVDTFVPGEVPRSPLIWDAEADVMAAVEYLKNHPKLDASRIGIVGASYSGEEMAEAGRLTSYVQLYVELSPGSFSDESIAGIDESGVPWLFVVCNNEKYLKEISALVQAKSKTVEFLALPGTEHATRLLEEYEDLAERIAFWISKRI